MRAAYAARTHTTNNLFVHPVYHASLPSLHKTGIIGAMLSTITNFSAKSLQLLHRFALRLILYSMFCTLLFFASIPYVQAATSPATTTQPDSPVLCYPAMYLEEPQDCLAAGPAEYLTKMGSLGISFPQRPLQAEHPSADLTLLPYLYLRLKANEATPIYNSMEAAIAGKNPTRWLEAGEMRYLSYIDAVNVNDQPKPDYFQLRDGSWVASSSVARRENAITRFQGITFTQTPTRSFGWVLPLNPYVETKRTPGYDRQDYTGHQITEYGIVEVFASQQVGDTLWHMIGPDEWVPQRAVGLVKVNTTPPEGVTSGRWVEVNLFEQTLAVYDQNRLVFATLIATGAKPFYTRPGVFPIYKRLEVTPMSGSFEADRSDYYYLDDVPYVMYYDQARALHGAYWRTRFGFPQSHGCVNLSPADARWIFEWAKDGDSVYVWDPSGQTPTDPAFYGEGGA